METSLNDILRELLADPTARVDEQWVIDMAHKYPCFVVPAALLLKRSGAELDDDTRRRLLAMVAMNSADRTAMADFIDINGDEWSAFYPQEHAPEAPSTENAISTFLDTYGSTSPEEEALLERLIFNPVPADYFGADEAPADGEPLLPAELAPDHHAEAEPATPAEPEAEEDVQSELDKPTAADSKPQKRQHPSAPSQNPPDDGLLSESLAKIFIKQGRYERAYEIISNLSLKFPEKSIYFADQMRFLQKLIFNQQHLTK